MNKRGNPIFGAWNPENLDKPYRSGTSPANLREIYKCPSCEKEFISLFRLNNCIDHDEEEEVKP